MASGGGKISRLLGTLRSTDQPLTVGLVVGLGLGAGLAWAIAYALGSSYVPLAIVIGAYLGAVSLTGTLLIAVRLTSFLGFVAVATILLAQVTTGLVVLQALALAALAYAGAVWTLVPYVGPLGGGFAPMLFVLLAALFKVEDLSRAGSGPVVAGLAGVAAAVIVAVIAHLRDPLGPLRAQVANAWKPEATLDQQLMTVEVAQLSGRPALLSTLLRLAAVATVSRSVIPPKDNAALITEATAADSAVADAIGPPGPLVPRTVKATVPTLPSAGPAHPGLDRWLACLRSAVSLLAGREQATRPKRIRVSFTLISTLALFRPSDSMARYGLQRAVALGASWIVLALVNWPQALWVLITLLAVLQPGSPVTLARAFQRGIGTLVGALIAVAVAYVVPAEVLSPWLAGLAMLVGVLFIRRNYTATSAFVAAAIVFIVGVSAGTPLTTAGIRILDTVIGILFGWLIATFVLPVRASLIPRRNRALDAISSYLSTSSGGDLRSTGAALFRASHAVADYRADLPLIRPDATPSPAQATADVNAVDTLLRQVTMLALLRSEDALDADLDAAGEKRLAERLDSLRDHPFDSPA